MAGKNEHPEIREIRESWAEMSAGERTEAIAKMAGILGKSAPRLSFDAEGSAANYDPATNTLTIRPDGMDNFREILAQFQWAAAQGANPDLAAEAHDRQSRGAGRGHPAWSENPVDTLRDLIKSPYSSAPAEANPRSLLGEPDGVLPGDHRPGIPRLSNPAPKDGGPDNKPKK
jgi:hypothetical protein